MNSKERFSDRVQDYVRYRPTYPRALIAWLQSKHGVTPKWEVADVGSGTGISSQLFLEAGHRVVSVEPNAAMRQAAEAWLGGNQLFASVAGSAEATTLPSQTVDLVSAAQAFHWFDQQAVRAEWKRILRPTGLAAIYWNSRRLSGTPFLSGYESLLREYGVDYAAVAEAYPDDEHMRIWYGSGFRGATRFDNVQRIDFDGLRGRLLSSSYAPKEGHPAHAPMLSALQRLFDETAQLGAVEMVYDTRVFVGHVS